MKFRCQAVFLTQQNKTRSIVEIYSDLYKISLRGLVHHNFQIGFKFVSWRYSYQYIDAYVDFNVLVYGQVLLWYSSLQIL